MIPRDLLEVADDLLDGPKEAHWRSAVSRAYYATFHGARLLLRRCGFLLPKGERSHAYLWLRLSNCGHADLTDAGAELFELRNRRNWADYDFDPPMDQSAAQDYVQKSRDILNLLEQAMTIPSLLAQITTVIRTYERDVLKETTWHSNGADE